MPTVISAISNSPIILLQISLRLQVVPGMICTLCNYGNKGKVILTVHADASWEAGEYIIIFIC